MMAPVPFRESKWLVPFAVIALAALSLLRPPPRFPPPAQYRIVKDAGGVEVPIGIPFRSSVLTWCGFGAGGYLGHTHSPQTLLSAGTQIDRERFAEGIWSWLYPESLQRDSLWQSRFRRRFPELETVLGFDAGAYIGGCGATGVISSLRAVGLPALGLNVGKGKNWDEEHCAWRASKPRSSASPNAAKRDRNLQTSLRRPRRGAANADADGASAHLDMDSRTDNLKRKYTKSTKNDYRITCRPRASSTPPAQFPKTRTPNAFW